MPVIAAVADALVLEHEAIIIYSINLAHTFSEKHDIQVLFNSQAFQNTFKNSDDISDEVIKCQSALPKPVMPWY